MPRTGRTRYAILGMLMSGPRSGYDLKGVFEQRIRHFWSESVGQIYPALHRLHAEGLVSVRTERRRAGPARKVYRITKAGAEAFRAWLTQPAAASTVRNELLLKLYFGPEMSPRDVLAHLERFETHQRELRTLFRFFEDEVDRTAASTEQRLFYRLALSSGRHVNRARLAWCREARAAVEAHAAEVAPESDR